MPYRGELLSSELVSQYRCMNLSLKLTKMIEHKNDTNTYGHCFFQGPCTSTLSDLFWNLEDPVLVQTLSYRRKITYHPLLVGVFNAGYWAYAAFTCQCISTNSFRYSYAPVSYFLPITKMLS